MRLNKYLAQHTSLSRRKADEAIKNGQITIDGKVAELGNEVNSKSVITVNGVKLTSKNTKRKVVLIDKPVGYVCSKDGQGSPSIYELLAPSDQNLNIAGRLDKDSSGLVLFTNDGEFLNSLTHPSHGKTKKYEIVTKKPLSSEDIKQLVKGVDIGDSRPSCFTGIESVGDKSYSVILAEGRNRQIRRSIQALNNEVVSLRRTHLADYSLEDIKS